MGQQFDRHNDHLPQRGFFEQRVLAEPPYQELETAANVLAALRFNENNEQAHILAKEEHARNLHVDLLRLEKDPVIQELSRQLQESDRILCAAVPPESDAASYQRALLYLTRSGFLVCHSRTWLAGEETVRQEFDQRVPWERLIRARHLPREQLYDFVARGVGSEQIIENLIAHSEHGVALEQSAEQSLRELLDQESARHAQRAA